MQTIITNCTEEATLRFTIYLEGEMRQTQAEVHAATHFSAMQAWLAEFLANNPDKELTPDRVIVGDLSSLSRGRYEMRSWAMGDQALWQIARAGAGGQQKPSPREEFVDLCEIANRMDRIIPLSWRVIDADPEMPSYRIAPIEVGVPALRKRLENLLREGLMTLTDRGESLGRSGVVTIGTGENAWSGSYAPLDTGYLFNSAQPGHMTFHGALGASWHQDLIISG